MNIFEATADLFTHFRPVLKDQVGWRHEVERVIWRRRFARAAFVETWSIKMCPTGDRATRKTNGEAHLRAHRAANRRLDLTLREFERVMDPANVCRLLDEVS